MTLHSTAVCAVVSDASANCISCPLWLLQYVSSDLRSSSANRRDREQSQPVIEAALVWIKKKNRLFAPPAGFFWQIRPISGILQTNGNWMATGSQDGGVNDFSWCSKCGRVWTTSHIVPLTKLCCSAALLQVIKNNLNPTWRPFRIPIQPLCAGDVEKPIKVEEHTLTRTRSPCDVAPVVKNVWSSTLLPNIQICFEFLNDTLKVQCVIFDLILHFLYR